MTHDGSPRSVVTHIPEAATETIFKKICSFLSGASFLNFSRRLYVFTQQIPFFQEHILCVHRTDTDFPGAPILATEQITIFQEAFFEYQRTDFQEGTPPPLNRYFSIRSQWLLSIFLFVVLIFRDLWGALFSSIWRMIQKNYNFVAWLQNGCKRYTLSSFWETQNSNVHLNDINIVWFVIFPPKINLSLHKQWIIHVWEFLKFTHCYLLIVYWFPFTKECLLNEENETYTRYSERRERERDLMKYSKDISKLIPLWWIWLFREM